MSKVKLKDVQPFIIPEDWKHHVVVEMWKEVFSGQAQTFAEVAYSRQVQTFYPEIFERLTAEGQDGKSWFAEGLLKYTILHDPRKTVKNDAARA